MIVSEYCGMFRISLLDLEKHRDCIVHQIIEINRLSTKIFIEYISVNSHIFLKENDNSCIPFKLLLINT